MKNIILTIITLLFFTSNIHADLNFRMQIPQPDFLSNDWDGDGEINSVDTDDDGDGVDDVNDSTPFGQSGQSSTTIPPEYAYTGDTCEQGELSAETVSALNAGLSQSGYPKSAAQWCSTTSVTFYWNRSHIPPEIGALTNLTRLTINEHPTVTLPAEIGALKNLEYLEVNNVNNTNGYTAALTYLPEEINFLYKLKSIRLQTHFIDTIPEIHNLINLDTLIIVNFNVLGGDVNNYKVDQADVDNYNPESNPNLLYYYIPQNLVCPSNMVEGGGSNYTKQCVYE